MSKNFQIWTITALSVVALYDAPLYVSIPFAIAGAIVVYDMLSKKVTNKGTDEEDK